MSVDKLFLLCIATTLITALAVPARPAAAEDAVEAKQLWAKSCASCHGEDGKAETKVGNKLGVKDLTDAAVRANFDQQRMIAATRDGVTNEEGKKVMKGYADKLSEAQIKALVDYIHTAFGG